MSTVTPQQPAVLTNQQFYIKCVRIGSTAKTAVREFLALLPEAEDRQIYLEHGISNIFEFAAKLGGVSKEQVQRVLQLSERFETTPALKQALVSGDISLAKLSRVASVATPENQDFWVSKAELLSQPALETLVRDSKAITSTDSVRSHSANPNKIVQKVLQSDELKLSPKIMERLLALQNKGLDLNQLLEELLDHREQKIQQEKEEMAGEKHLKPPSNSRYISKKIKSVLKQEFGTKCAHSNCTNASINIHHQQRFALDPRHNPIYLLPLCKQHHEIAHSIDIKSIQQRKNHAILVRLNV